MKKFELPPLPFAPNALEPHISEKTIEFHYGKHHQAYINNLNTLKEGTEFEDAGLEDIIMNAQGGLFNNAAQVWNHTFYWNCLSPNGGGVPQGQLGEDLAKKFGSFENFKAEFTKAASSFFGSGWVWLVDSEEKGLEIIGTSNAANPLTENKEPLLVIDVWEHAYYLDQQNRRPDYIAHFWEIVNWKAIEERY